MNTGYASFVDRLFAQLFNLLLLVAVLSPLVYLLNVLVAPGADSPIALAIFRLVRLLFIVTASIFIMAWFTHRYGGSPGKCLQGLRVIRETTHANLSLTHAAARSTLALMSMASLIGVLLILFDTRRRALHDHIIGSVVIEGADDYANQVLPADWEQHL